MTRRMSPTRRTRIFDAAGGVCHICSQPIQPGELWDADHLIPYELTRDDSDENLRPAHARCHRGADSKTSADAKVIAKAKRVRSKHIGAHKPTSRLTHPTLKRKVNGTVVPRNG
jgi:5-methylcytosine-specific restriction protein A